VYSSGLVQNKSARPQSQRWFLVWVVFVQLQGHHAASVYISARSPPVSSPIEAEAFGLLLAVKVADCLHLQNSFEQILQFWCRQPHVRTYLQQILGLSDISSRQLGHLQPLTQAG
jgi:hypothetical protein